MALKLVAFKLQDTNFETESCSYGGKFQITSKSFRVHQVLCIFNLTHIIFIGYHDCGSEQTQGASGKAKYPPSTMQQLALKCSPHSSLWCDKCVNNILLYNHNSTLGQKYLLQTKETEINREWGNFHASEKKLIQAIRQVQPCAYFYVHVKHCMST